VEKYPKPLSEFMQWALHIVETLCAYVGLSLNLYKTELFLFTRKWKLLRFIDPRFCGCCISVKHLVFLDSRPTCKERVDVKVRKVENVFRACRMACAATWVLSHMVFIRLYVSTIRRLITFASLVWWSSYQTANTKKRLSRLP